jgi:Co/Zn/Cd efflux system component
MRSAWLCSRNDVIANVSVLLAAGAVAVTGSGWPDIVVGLAIATMFGSSAFRVILDARRQLRTVPAGRTPRSPLSFGCLRRRSGSRNGLHAIRRR